MSKKTADGDFSSLHWVTRCYFLCFIHIESYQFISNHTAFALQLVTVYVFPTFQWIHSTNNISSHGWAPTSNSLPSFEAQAAEVLEAWFGWKAEGAKVGKASRNWKDLKNVIVVSFTRLPWRFWRFWKAGWVPSKIIRRLGSRINQKKHPEFHRRCYWIIPLDHTQPWSPGWFPSWQRMWFRGFWGLQPPPQQQHPVGLNPRHRVQNPGWLLWNI